MAKRVAGQQLTKDGTMSDEDVFTVGSQIGGPQRATAAQMAQRRLAKPRGGRRPGSLRPPASPSPTMSAPQHQNTNSFGEGDRLSVNGNQQQGGFSFGQQPNGFQPNQNSSSFPPYPSNSFNPPFTAPTTGFNFNAGQAQEVNNPFTAINTHNAPPPEQTGFQGSIFNIPPQKMSPFQKFLEGEQKPLFAPGAPDISTSSQSQPPNNLFNQSTNNQQPGQASPSIFSQPNAQQQPTNHAFGQSAEQDPPQPGTEIFAHLKTSQDQSSSNPFAQSLAHFQQQQPAQPAANLFAHLGQPQQSSSFLTQGSTSPTHGGSSVMQTSPDPSPQSRPFGFLNQPTNQAQTSPTKQSSAQGGGGSLFDRISKPLETRSEPSINQNKDSAGQGSGGSLFDRISKPFAENNATKITPTTGSSNPFSMLQPPSTSKASNKNGATSPTKISERKIAKPTLFQSPSEEAHPSYKAIFGDLKPPASSQASNSPITQGISAVSQSSPSQNHDGSVSPSRNISDTMSSSVSAQQSNGRRENAPSNQLRFGPPPAPEGYSEEEARKWFQDWWISFYVLHKEKRIKSAERQCYERTKAIQNGFDPLEQIAGSKRKIAIEKCRGEEEDGNHEKRARVGDSSIFTQELRGVSSNGNGPYQSPSKSDIPVQQVINKNNKRSADEEPQRENAQGTAESGKKVRGHDPVSYPSLPGAASSSSQTSNIFKNILHKNEDANVNGIQKSKAAPLFQFPASSGSSSNQSPMTSKSPSTTPLSSQLNAESPPKPSFSTFNPNFSVSKTPLSVNQQSNSNRTQAITSTPLFKPTDSAAAPSTAPDPAPFSFKPATSSGTPSDATKALAVKFSVGDTTSIEPSSTPFSAKPTADGQTPSGDTKAPAFNVPTFGTGASSTTSNTNPFSIKSSVDNSNSSESQKAPTFKIPNFGAGASSTNFLSQFGKAAEKTAAEEKKKRKAADYDSEEEDLASWERRDAEEQQSKKQKLEQEIKGKAAKLVDGKWVITADDKSLSTSSKQAEPTDPNASVLSQPRALLTNGYNIFGHLSGEESGAEGSKTCDADDEDENDDETQGPRQARGPFDYDEYDSEPEKDEEGQANESKAFSNPFGANKNGLNGSPSRDNPDTAEKPNGEDTGRSIFDRISRDKDGNPIREISPPGSQATTETSNVLFKSVSSENLFIQRSEAASSFTSTNSKVEGSPRGDHTWKADSPIKFGGSSNPPAVNVTFPSPSKPTFGGLFGAQKPNVTTEASTKPISNVFSNPPAKTPSVGFSFGLKPVTASLAPPSNNESNNTSRATSPGATTGESANESNADGEDDKAENQKQIDLTSLGPGEEDEDVVLQVKAKALKWDTTSSAWVSKGVGPLRVLKNRESHLTRVLLRQDPSGRIVLNFALSKSFTYESSQSKSVRVPFVGENGKIETWMIKVGNDEDAKKLASALEDNKH